MMFHHTVSGNFTIKSMKRKIYALIFLMYILMGNLKGF